MKKITKTGEDFIRTICSGTSNSLIVGKYDYILPFSNVTSGITFSASTVNDNGNPIINNSQLGDQLIKWYNQYGELNDVDSNILAVQGFLASGYRLWHYDNNRSGSGIAGLNSKRIFSHMVRADRPSTIEAMGTFRLLPEETALIIAGIEEPDSPNSYKYNGYSLPQSAIDRSKRNRLTLHQNIVNNPELSIKTQAALVKEIMLRNGNRTTTTLFAYSRDIGLSNDNYRLMLDEAGRKYNDDYVRVGVEYVKKVFGILGDKNNDKQQNITYGKPKGKWFGYDIDFTTNSFSSFLG